MQPYEVLYRPLITEKGSGLQAQNKYVFKVNQGANKLQVKQAVEKAFRVKVASVNVMTVPGRMRRMRNRQVLSPAWKKAIVTVRPGDKIEFFENV